MNFKCLQEEEGDRPALRKSLENEEGAEVGMGLGGIRGLDGEEMYKLEEMNEKKKK